MLIILIIIIILLLLSSRGYIIVQYMYGKYAHTTILKLKSETTLFMRTYILYINIMYFSYS